MLRFLRYVSVTVPSFLFDLGILYFLKDTLGVQYMLATGIAFVCATTANYFLSRRFVFQGSHRSLEAGYFYFLGISAAGLFAVVSFMGLFVGVLHFNYLVSRIGIALIEGLWNYLMNLYVNFKVAKR